MKYLEYISFPEGIEILSKIFFKFNDGTVVEGMIKGNPVSCSNYFVRIDNDNNDLIFRKLNLSPHEFVKDTVGYAKSGIWPEVNTLHDLEKVLIALQKVNKPEEVEEEIKEETPKPTDEWDWLLN